MKLQCTIFAGGKNASQWEVERVEVTSHGGGKHQLTIHILMKADRPHVECRTSSDRGNNLISICEMNLVKREGARQEEAETDTSYPAIG